MNDYDNIKGDKNKSSGGGACADATAVLKDTGGATISTTNIPSGTPQDITAPIGQADLQNTLMIYLGSVAVKSNEVKAEQLPNQSWTNTNGDAESTPYTDAITCDPTVPVGDIMKTGQTIVYAAGDDGTFQAGRANTFFILPANNPFGNTNRFTDILGGQTYADNIVLDWSTYNNAIVLGYRRTENGVNINWSNAIIEAQTLTVGSFNSGWRLPNRSELFNIIYFGSGVTNIAYNYAPFLISSLVRLWTSTTNAANTANVYYCDNTLNWTFSAQAKTTTTISRYIPVREFTNAELGI